MAHRLIKEQNWGILQQRPRNSRPLLLTSTDHQSPLSNLGLIPLWQPHNSIMHIRLLRGRNHFFVGGV